MLALTQRFPVDAQVPEVNSSWLADAIRSYKYVDISVSMGVSDGTCW